MAATLLQKLDDETSAIRHWSMAADEQMQLCEEMFTSLGCVEVASTSLEVLRQFLRSIKAQYTGEASLNRGMRRLHMALLHMRNSVQQCR